MEETFPAVATAQEQLELRGSGGGNQTLDTYRRLGGRIKTLIQAPLKWSVNIDKMNTDEKCWSSCDS